MNLVIPRDLYNHGNLLTNYGHLYIQLEKLNLQDLLVNEVVEGENFHIGTMEMSGCTYLSNVRLYSQNGNEIELFRHFRHLNSRDTHSLWFIGEDDDYHVFNEDGSLTTKLLEAIGYIE